MLKELPEPERKNQDFAEGRESINLVFNSSALLVIYMYC